MVEERWVAVDDVAAHLGITRDTVYRWLEKRKLPAHRVGRVWRFKLTEVDEWVRRGAAGSDEEGSEFGNRKDPGGTVACDDLRQQEDDQC